MNNADPHVSYMRSRTHGPAAVLFPLPARPNAAYTAPKASKDHLHRAHMAAEDTAGSPSPATRRVTVLIAEDEETIAETLAMIVEDAGFVPVVARDGREALALARQHRPHLIITDLMMPYMSGADLIAAVRGEANTQGLPPPSMIVVTAASRARAEEAGADEVILKPFDVARIEAVMRQLLQDQSR